MATAFTLIQSESLTSNQATVTFSTIPATFTNLKLLVSARTNGAFLADTLYVSVNGTTTNFNWKNVYGRAGSSAVSQNGTDNQLSSAINGANSSALMFSNTEIDFLNYSETIRNKSICTIGCVENNSATGDNHMDAILWANTAAIYSIVLSPIPSSVFVTNSSFYLYGIKNT